MGAGHATLNLAQEEGWHSQVCPLTQEITIKKEEGMEAELLTVQFQSLVTFKDVAVNYTKEE